MSEVSSRNNGEVVVARAVPSCMLKLLVVFRGTYIQAGSLGEDRTLRIR